MFLKKIRNLRHTLALRLTLWYAGVFAVSSLLAFALAYVLIAAVVQKQTDEDLQEDIEEYAAYLRRGGLDRVKAEMAVETEGGEANKTFIRVWVSGGRPVMTTDLTAWAGLMEAPDALAQLADTDEPIRETLKLPAREHKVRTIHGLLAPGVVIQIGESLEENEEFLATLRWGFVLVVLVVMIVGGPVGWFMARRALRGVQQLTRTAAAIADGALDRRVTVGPHGDEIDTLARTFNTMLERIQALIIGMREMTDNLAHDLRSPLGRIRASAEMILLGGGSKAEAEAMVAITAEECDRLLELINTTLDIAEAESGAAKLKLTDIDLVEMVADAVELFQPLAEDKQITLATDLPECCPLQGDRHRLQRVIANLLDNALKYTPGGGRVHIKLRDEGERLELAVEDTGIGIPADETARIFERFYRCDRSRSERGNGLGLSLALAFMRAHGGDIRVNSTPGQGSAFTAVFPRSPTA
jgi:heavy metal sensor kinase